MTEKKIPIDSYGALRPGQWLKCHHLAGEPRTFKVTAFYGQEFPKRQKNETTGEVEEFLVTKGVLEFEGTALRYMTQLTNEALLQAIFGPDPSAVVGQWITLGPARDRFGREMVDAIRIVGAPSLKKPIRHTVTYAKKSGRPPKEFELIPTTIPTGPDHDLALEQAITSIETCDPEALDAILSTLRDRKWTRAQNVAIKQAITARKKSMEPEPATDTEKK